VISLLKRESNKDKDLIVLIDGEHYPQVTYDAIAMLKRIYPGNFKGIIFLGGTEKLVEDDLEDFFGEEIYKIKNLDLDFIKALKHFKPDIVYDLSDEPVVNYIIRMKIASFCLYCRCSYMGPDFLFSYDEKSISCKKPSLAIIGTGKRIGKTAVSSYVAKIYTEDNIDVCIIAMGRGGPNVPQVIRGDKINITPEYLLEISRKGMHASSDYIEDALTAGVTTVGCRRCGGGFGGKIFMSNVEAGVNIAENLGPDLIIVEGSGASVPDIETDKNICIIGAGQSWENIVGYLGIYRILCADLIIITMCEEPTADKKKISFLESEIKKVKPGVKVIRTIFRPRPLSDISGKKIFMAMTASKIIGPRIKDYMEKNYNCKIQHVSFNLSNRKQLKKDLKNCNDCNTILTEIKAASVDLLTDYAIKHKKGIIYMNNIPVIIGGKEILKRELKQIFSKDKSLNEKFK
jgi:cyclic 2,3-diphosphoglycerate synthetase